MNINRITKFVSLPRIYQLLAGFKKGKIKSDSAKMINHMNIIGVREPEKLAEGLCPHCQARIYLWLTDQGVEMSINGFEVKEPPQEQRV